MTAYSESVTQKINVAFAEAMFKQHSAIRFGMKTCKDTYEHEYLHDLMEMHGRALELEECENGDQMLDSCAGCTLDTIEEKILTLIP